MKLPEYTTSKEYHISPEGLQRILNHKDPLYPARNVLWATDMDAELPIRMGKDGIASLKPTTLIEEFKQAVSKYALRSALSVKINSNWVGLH